MKTTNQLINNVTGQLNGVNRMIDEDEDVFKVLTQMKAARSALESAMNKYIQDHFWEYLRECENKENSCKKFLQELLNT